MGLHLVLLLEVPHTPKCDRRRCHFGLLGWHYVQHLGRKQPEIIKELLEIVT
jgi:hypothetical protein